jgi:hypothetical protein
VKETFCSMEGSTLMLRTLFPTSILMAIRDNFNWAHIKKYIQKFSYKFEIIFLICKLVISGMPSVHENFTVTIIITEYVTHKGKHLKCSGRLNFCPRHLFQYYWRTWVVIQSLVTVTTSRPNASFLISIDECETLAGNWQCWKRVCLSDTNTTYSGYKKFSLD